MTFTIMDANIMQNQCIKYERKSVYDRHTHYKEIKQYVGLNDYKTLTLC